MEQPLAPVPVRRLSDDELLRTEFRYRDPEKIPGLNLGVPNPQANPTIIGYYDETPEGGRRANPDARMIRCCHCGLRRHWKGYVVQDDHQEIYIIGAQHCGHNHYGGERFSDAENLFRQEIERQKALRRWRNMMQLVPALKAEVDLLLSCNELRRIEMKCEEIKRASPEGFAALIRNHRSGKPMIEVRETRDHAAEAKREEKYQRALAEYHRLPVEERRRRRDDGLKPEEDTSPIIVRISEELGVLAGAGFLTADGDIRSALLDLRKTLRTIDVVNANTTEKAWVANLNRLLREMTDIPKRVWGTQLELAFARLFFERANLERIERWSRPFARFSYLTDHGGLIVQDAGRGRTRIEPLLDAELPAMPTIEGMQYRTDEFLPMMVEAA